MVEIVMFRLDLSLLSWVPQVVLKGLIYKRFFSGKIKFSWFV